jgi:tetratricopeptide (TPR) repeat protein
VPAAHYYYMKEMSSGPSSTVSYSYLGCAAASVDPNDFYGDVSWAYISDNPVSGAGATWKRAVSNDYWIAREMMRSKNYQSAYNLFMDLLNNDETENKAECMQLAMQAAKKMGTFAEQREFLQGCLKNDDQKVREAAEVWLSILFEHLGELDKAQEMVEKTDLTGESKLSMLFNLAASCDAAGFDDKAIAIFEQMMREFPEEKEEVLEYIRDMNHNNVVNNNYFGTAASATTTSAETALAYPNPFNAATKISYFISESRHIKIVVFNLLGQKVRTLTDAKMEAGRHEVLWDGLDDFGITASSGLYFITADNAWTVKIALVR